MAMVTEIAVKGMRTRAVEDVAGEKRRKVGDGELRSPTSTLIQISTEKITDGPCVPAGSLSSDRSTKKVQFTDLKESVKLKFHPYRKSKNDIKDGSGLQEIITAKSSTVNDSRRTVPAEKLPSATELEEFFASAERELQKRFKDKYNYDIVNDAPLEGRFEWIQLKP